MTVEEALNHLLNNLPVAIDRCPRAGWELNIVKVLLALLLTG